MLVSRANQRVISITHSQEYQTCTAQNKDFFSKCDQIRRELRIWSYLLKKSLMENFIFCAVFQDISTSHRFVYR